MRIIFKLLLIAVIGVVTQVVIELVCLYRLVTRSSAAGDIEAIDGDATARQIHQMLPRCTCITQALVRHYQPGLDKDCTVSTLARAVNDDARTEIGPGVAVVDGTD